MRRKATSLILFLIIGVLPTVAWGRLFTVASYNVENLFDAHRDGNEYPDYVPGGPHGWNAAMATIKTENIVRVIKKLTADIVCLQEVESARSLKLLVTQLNNKGASYPFSAIADQKQTTVKCAILSKFPITQQSEIDPGNDQRAILKVTVKIDNRPLIIFVNHWRSKQNTESLRIQAARALQHAIKQLPTATDFILAGDLNSNYNEYRTILNEPHLNDTSGMTGINHILRTVKNNEMADEKQVRRQDAVCLYNLWLELPPYRRWSYNFYGQKNSLDHLIIPAALYDRKGISYVDNSFDTFDADFLLQYESPYRWQRAERGRGRHLGKGFSDHLPIFARFTTSPFQPAAAVSLHQGQPSAGKNRPPSAQSIASLYKTSPGRVNIRLNNCVVIYTHKNSAIIKQQPHDRAIFIYKAAAGLQSGDICDLAIKRLKTFYGLREITEISAIDKKGTASNLASFLLSDASQDFARPQLQNEVIGQVRGIYHRNRFHYGNKHTIRLYFKNKIQRPPEKSTISLTKVRIGFHNTPELVIEKRDQIRLIQPIR